MANKKANEFDLLKKQSEKERKNGSGIFDYFYRRFETRVERKMRCERFMGGKNFLNNFIIKKINI